MQNVTLAYDEADRRTSVTLPNGIQISYAYDDASQLTGITYRKSDGTPIGDLTYQYDTAGRRIRMGGSLARTTLPAAVASAAYDANNRLTNWGGLSLTYDDNGNLIGEGTATYTWNARNQLAAASQGAASYGYDAAGRRRSRTVSGIGLQTLHDGWNPIQLKQAGAAVESRLYGMGLDEIYGRTNSGASQSYLTDALGSVLELANADQTAQADYTYGAYGQTSESPPGASSNLIKYTGREQDTANLYYYRNRYYSPVTSRFISEDPIGLAGGVNLYVYAAANPLSAVDPEGLGPSPGTALGGYNAIRCFFALGSVSEFAKQCDKECPPDDIRGMAAFIDKYGGGDLDAAKIECMCQKAGPRLCHDVIRRCLGGARGIVGAPRSPK